MHDDYHTVDNINTQFFQLAGTIKESLLLTVANAPVVGPKDLYVENCLDEIFADCNWEKTFDIPLAINYTEVITPEIIIILHRWLRKRCANIENVYVIITNHTGIAKWWKSWCDCFHEKSFKIVELFLGNSWVNDFITSDLPNLEFYKKSKKINKIFNFYGGTYSTLEREYLILKLLDFRKVANIEYLFSNFSSKQEILNYVEGITYFGSQCEVDNFSKKYDQIIQSPSATSGIQKEPFNYNEYQWKMDQQSWATVIRETINDNQFSTITEKTVRAFVHHTVAIPICFNSVNDLEKLKFWFPTEIFDYSYQNEPLFSKRMEKLTNSLHKLISTYSLSQLEQHYFDNIKKFHYNAELVYKYHSSNSLQIINRSKNEKIILLRSRIV